MCDFCWYFIVYCVSHTHTHTRALAHAGTHTHTHTCTQTKSSIESEEDADAAFKISTALTQALLAYRLKNVAVSQFMYVGTTMLSMCYLLW